MVTIFSTGKAGNQEIKNISDSKIKDFDDSLHTVMLSLSKEWLLTVKVHQSLLQLKFKIVRQRKMQKNSFSIANSPLVKTAIAGEDPNWENNDAIGKAG